MDFIIYGTEFGHKRGEFCTKQISDFYFVSHFHTDFLYEHNGRLVEGRAGDIMIMPPKTPIYHGPRADADRGFINDWIYVSGEDFIRLLSRYPLPLGTPFRFSSDRIIGRCIEGINREKSYALPGYAEKCDLYMTETIIDIFRLYTGNELVNDSSSKLRRLRAEIARDPRRNWTLSDMAGFCGYSESRFSALYKETFRISPIKDLLKIKMESAKLLLTHSPLSVTEIAEAVGFGTIYYFSKYFKDYVGVSPTEYKNDPF